MMHHSRPLLASLLLLAVMSITAIGACNISGRRGFIDGPHMHFCVASQLGCLP